MTDGDNIRDCLSDSPAAGSVAIEALCRPAGSHSGPLHVQRFERVIAAMSRHLDKPMTNAKMADIACLSPSHFNRLFRSATGIPPIHFHYALRLDFAKRLLVETDLSITEICFEVGYNSLGTFVSRFSQLVGLSPSAFRSLTREFAKICLSDLGALINDVDEWSPGKPICGAIAEPTDGIVFTALFPRAIPAGVPRACGLSSGTGSYGLPNPGNGSWYVFAVSVPRAATGIQLTTLDGLRRGRSGPIRVEGNRCLGANEIKLAQARSLDPPILTALPVLLSRLLTAGVPRSRMQTPSLDLTLC